MAVCIYLSAVDIVEHKVQLVSGLEGVVKPHQEGMFDVLHQHTALGHDMLLLEGGHQVMRMLRPSHGHSTLRHRRFHLMTWDEDISKAFTSFFFMMIFFCRTLTA